MAIAHSHARLLIDLRAQNIIGGGRTRSMLEFGEQNWFGDVSPEELFGVIDRAELDDGRKRSLRDDLRNAIEKRERFGLFDIAKIFYSVTFEYERYVAIDLHGSPVAQQLDLNEPLPFEDKFDVVTNLGTSEHVFNQYQVFKSIHDHVRPSGLMIHSLPNQGCYDHGFYNYHPTFFHDLCETNGYQMIAFILADCSQMPHKLVQLTSRADYVRLAVDGKLSAYSALFAILRQTDTVGEFRVPRQGYYDNKLPAELAKAWNSLPR